MRASFGFVMLVWLSAGLAACSADNTAGDGGGPSSDGGGTGGSDGGGPSPSPSPVCQPSCSGKQCGDDGCGGVCGSCMAGQLCQANACAALTGEAIQVDVAGGRHAIHPEVYGLAAASSKTAGELNIGVNREGGNGATLYNWQLDVHNSANDYFFENIADQGTGTFGQPGYVSSVDKGIGEAKALGVASLITIPTIGWTPKDRVPNHPFTCSFPVSKYGAQQKTDPYDPNCGNGLSPSGQKLTSDPTIATTQALPAFEKMWLDHLVGTFGAAQSGGVRFYALDNEMNLWGDTHRDVHPMPTSFDEVWQKTVDYAPQIRAADPSATILGFGTWGVLDVFDSELDTTNGAADRKAHGGTPLLEWYLEQLASYQQAHGVRLVDCLDLHYYPQGGDPLENTRSLWDPTYHDPSWIDGFLGEPVQLFPRLVGWIQQHYPGTGICVSEYNWNLDTQSDGNAALAEADVLGLFGVWGIRLAAYWTTPVDGQGNPLPAYWAFKLLRNYDGAKGSFGDTSVTAATTLAGVAVYAAERASDGAITVLVINKATSAQSGNLALKSFTPGPTAKVYRHVAGSGAISAAPDVGVSGGKLPVSLPAHSLTLFVIPKA